MSNFQSDNQSGLITADSAARFCYIQRLKNAKSVFTNGVFDILHRGHIDYLTKAKALGQILIIGLNSDESVKRLKGSTRPFNNEQDRAYSLLALKCVDYVVLFSEDTPLELIAKIKPSVLVKGADYEAKDIAGYDTVIKNGGQVLTIPFISGYSTTTFIDKIIASSR